VTAANLLAAAALKAGNRGVQAFPHFGAERRGAPVKAFARISDSEVNLRSQIYDPNIIVVLDAGLMDIIDITEGAKKETVIIINTPAKPQDFEFSKTYRVATVDATGIAIKYNLLLSGIPIINTPILGALPHFTERVGMEHIIGAIKERFRGEAGEANANAANDTYKATEVNS